MANNALSDIDLIIGWNAAAAVFDDAVRTLARSENNAVTIASCHKAMAAANDEMDDLMKVAAGRNLLLERRKPAN